MKVVLHCLSVLMMLLLLGVSHPALAGGGTIAGPQPVPQKQIDDIGKIVAGLPANSTFARFALKKNMGQQMHYCIRKAPPGSQLSDEEWQERYTARYTYCMRMIIGEAASFTLQAVTDYMRPAMYAVILLATVIMGTKAVGGMFRNVKVETALFILKIMMVVAVFENMAAIGDLFFGLTDWLLQLLGGGAAAVLYDGSVDSLACPSPIATSGPDKGKFISENYGNLRWIASLDGLDCMVKRLWGLTKSQEAITSLFAAAGSSLFTGTSGINMTMMAVGFVFSLGFFLFRTATMLVMAYGAIAVLMLVMPIFLLTVFFKFTEDMFFQRWLGKVVSTMVQPGIMLAFVYFATGVMDTLLFTGSQEYTKITLSANNTPQGGFNASATLARREKPTDPLLDANGNPVSNPADYEQVIEPIYKTMGIDLKQSIDDQVKRMKEIIYTEKLLNYDFKLSEDNPLFLLVDHQCSDAGNINASTQKIDKDIQDALINEAEKNLRSDPQVNEAQKTIDAMRQGLQAPPESKTFRRALKLACMAAKGVKWLALHPFKSDIEGIINSYNPEVPKLDLSGNQGKDANALKVHEAKIRKLTIAMVAFLILTATFHAFSNYIERIAASITRYLGFSLSIDGPSIGGKNPSQLIKSGMKTFEDGWSKANKDENASWIDRMGGGGVKSVLDSVLGRR